MVAAIDGVVKLFKVVNEVPPVATLYQLYVPDDPLADKPTVPVPHLTLPIGDGATGIAFTVATTEALGPSQPFSTEET